MHYVYKMINEIDEVVYVGESKNPKNRFRTHTFWDKTSKFFNHNLKLEIVAAFPVRKDAWQFQCDLQKQCGLKTDLDKNKENACKSNAQSKAGKIGQTIKVTCPYCGKISNPGSMGSHIKHKHK